MEHKTSLSSDEFKALNQKSNLMGVWLLVFNWGLIVVAFALPALWLNPLTVIVSMLLLANRQLGLGTLMHECAHYSLFKTRPLNQWVGQLFCGGPVLTDLDGYRRYHLQHHRDAGTTIDPDYPNYKDYPVTNHSLLRKALRDFTGITGVKTLRVLLLMNAGLVNYDYSYKSNSAEKTLGTVDVISNLIKNLYVPILTNVAMWGALYALGHGWLYLLWWASYITVYMFILRIRNAAEHANVPDLLNKDPLLHARTTYASWWERLMFAPNYVNYHLEHHIHPTVPCYNLKAFHHCLLENGTLDNVKVASGYPEIVRQLIR